MSVIVATLAVLDIAMTMVVLEALLARSAFQGAATVILDDDCLDMSD